MSNVGLYVVPSIALTPASLVSTTALASAINWLPATAYAKDARVLHPGSDGLPHVWVSLVASNTATPGTDESKWSDGGTDNRMALLDAFSSTRTTGASPLVITLRPGAAFTMAALFNLLGNQVRLEVLDSSGAVIFDETQDLQARDTKSWTDYFFNGFAGRRTQAIFKGLPFAVTGRVRITLTGTGTVGIGRAVMGRKQPLGYVKWGVSPYLTDYSRKEWNKDFGDYTWKVRDYSRGFRGSAVIKNDQLNRVWSILIAQRGVPALYVGSEDERFAETLVTLGVMQDSPASIDYVKESLLNFTVEGLT